MSTYYRVALTNGRYCEGGYLSFGIADDCGHNHKTEAAAERCQAKLVGYNKKTRTCSAYWYNSTVLETDAEGRNVPVRVATLAEQTEVA